MKRIKIEELPELIEDLLDEEFNRGFKSTVVQLSTRPPYMDRENSEIGELSLYDINLRKIIKYYIERRDGTIDLKEEIQWLNEWAKEFYSYSKKLRRKAAVLSKQLK